MPGLPIVYLILCDLYHLLTVGMIRWRFHRAIYFALNVVSPGFCTLWSKCLWLRLSLVYGVYLLLFWGLTLGATSLFFNDTRLEFKCDCGISQEVLKVFKFWIGGEVIENKELGCQASMLAVGVPIKLFHVVGYLFATLVTELECPSLYLKSQMSFHVFKLFTICECGHHCS